MAELNIAEKLFILSIEDDGGKISATAQATLRYGLAGAILAELAIEHRLYLISDENRLGLANSKPMGHPIFDEVLKDISAESKPRKIGHWIDVIGRKRIVRQVAQCLADHKVIRIEEKRALWFIPYEVYPGTDASAKFWVKQHLRLIVLAGEKAGPEDIALLSLLKACGFLPFLFTRDERQYAAEQVNKLVAGEVFGQAVSTLLAEIEAAMIAATMAGISS